MLDKVREIKVGNKKYKFKMTNKSILKIEEGGYNYSEIIAGLFDSKKFYTKALILLEATALDTKFNKNKFIDSLTPEQFQDELPDFTADLYLDYMGVDQEKTDESEEEKKENGKNKKLDKKEKN